MHKTDHTSCTRNSLVHSIPDTVEIRSDPVGHLYMYSVLDGIFDILNVPTPFYFAIEQKCGIKWR